MSNPELSSYCALTARRDCRAPSTRRQPLSRQQRAVRQHEQHCQPPCSLKHRSNRLEHGALTCAAAAAEVATEKATVKIGTRGSPLALAQAYMTRDFLKVCLLALFTAFNSNPYTLRVSQCSCLMQQAFLTLT